MTTTFDTDLFTADKLLEAKANDYVRYIGALVETTRLDGGGIMAPHRAVKGFLEKWPRSLHLDLFTKAATNPGTTLEPAWGAPLAALRPLSEGFVSFTRGPSLEGQLFAAGARRVPFQTSVPVQTGAGTYAWIGEGAATPVGNFQLASVTLPIVKSAGIIPISEELARLAAPASVIALRTDLAAGLNAFLGSQMFDPTIAGVTGVSPASLTNGSPSFGSAGSSEANAKADLKRLRALFYAANPGATAATLVMSPATLGVLGTALNAPTLAAGTRCSACVSSWTPQWAECWPLWTLRRF